MAATPPPYNQGTRVVGDARSDLSAALCRRYRAGESIRSMAADVGRSYGFVQALLKEQGVELRARGGATRGAEAVARREVVWQQVQAVRAELADGIPEAHEKPAKAGKKAKADKKSKKDKKSAKKDKSQKSKRDKKN